MTPTLSGERLNLLNMCCHGVWTLKIPLPLICRLCSPFQNTLIKSLTKNFQKPIVSLLDSIISGSTSSCSFTELYGLLKEGLMTVFDCCICVYYVLYLSFVGCTASGEILHPEERLDNKRHETSYVCFFECVVCWHLVSVRKFSVT